MVEKGGLLMKRYKRSLVVFTMLAFVFLGIVTTRNADSKIVTNVKADISDEELLAVVIEDFENAQVSPELTGDGWFINSVPKKYDKQETEAKLKQKNPVPTLEMKLINGGPNDLAPAEWSLTDQGKKKEKILGMKFKFRYPGYNSVHILAPREVDWKSKKPVLRYNPSTGKEEQERGLQLPGQSKAISLWVHGRGNPYDMEVWLKDYRGDTHVLKFGTVNFVGWRPLKVYIPASIPQSYESYPQTRVTKITAFVFRSQAERPAEELTQDTYFFLDQIKVLTDTYEVNFDGQDLHETFDGNRDGGKNSGGTTAPQK
jgi:hypothetical protein